MDKKEKIEKTRKLFDDIERGNIIKVIYESTDLSPHLTRNYILSCFSGKITYSEISDSFHYGSFFHINLIGNFAINGPTCGFDFDTCRIEKPSIKDLMEIKDFLLKRGYVYNIKKKELIKIK